MKEGAKFNLAFFLAAAAMVALSAAAIALIDPWDMTRLVEKKGVNAEKVMAGAGGGRRRMCELYLRGDYSTVILGTSRAGEGIDPRNPYFKDGRAMNASLPGSNMVEMKEVFDFCRDNGGLKRVVLTLDFLTFSTRRQVSGDFYQSILAGKTRERILVNYLTSFDALVDANRTVRMNRRGAKSMYTDTGFIDTSVHYQNSKPDNRKLFDFILARNFMIDRETYAGFRYGEDRLDIFEEILAECRKSGIDLILFINPVHARQLEAIRVLGLWDEFEKWKTDLAEAVDESNRGNPGAKPFELWDFAGYNEVTTEQVPRGPDDGAMRWWLDSSHYTVEVGEMIAGIAVGGEPPSKAGRPGLGEVVTPSKIIDRNRRVRQDREKYAASHPFEIKEVERLAEATKRFRPEKSFEKSGYLKGGVQGGPVLP